MTLWQRIGLTFQDKDGSVAVPEVVAVVASLNCIVCPFVDWVHRGEHYPVGTVSTSLMGLILALATAQRVRDGLWKPDHDEGEHQ